MAKEDSIAELVERIVERKLAERLKITDIVAGGDVSITSRGGDVHITTLKSGGKLYFNGMFFKMNNGVFEMHLPNGKRRVVPI